MKNILVLPTDKPSRYWMSKVTNNLNFGNPDLESGICKFKNIYITSDEEIKVGDWFITKTNDVLKVQKPERGYEPIGKKIILTTDQDLIKDGVQAIDDDFLKWFVENQSCEQVQVKKLFKANPKYDEGTRLTEKVGYWEYKIIIPKEEVVDFLGRTTFDLLKQTGVEWLIEEMDKNVVLIPIRIQEQAKKIEQQQKQQTIEEVFEWLTKNNYVTDLKETLIEQYKNQ